MSNKAYIFAMGVGCVFSVNTVYISIHPACTVEAPIMDCEAVYILCQPWFMNNCKGQPWHWEDKKEIFVGEGWSCPKQCCLKQLPEVFFVCVCLTCMLC